MLCCVEKLLFDGVVDTDAMDYWCYWALILKRSRYGLWDSLPTNLSLSLATSVVNPLSTYKYLYNKEKNRGMQQQITLLVNEKETEIDKKEDILNEVEHFYIILYESEGNYENQTKENFWLVQKKIK